MDVLQQLRWVVALASLVACSAVTYNRNALYFGPNLPLQQQYHPVLYSQQAYTPQAYSPQAYQPLNVRSGASQNYHPQQQYVQQQYVQQQHIPLQSQHQRVLLYNPASGQYSQQAFPAGAYPMPQGAVFPYPPLRAQGEGGSGGGSGSGGGWGFNPSEYLTILQNYWQSFSGSTQSGKPPSEPAPSGAEAPTPVSPDGTDSSNNAAAAMASPGGAQRFFVVSQPVAPVALPSASNGAVSTYLLLQNQPVYSSWLGQQDNSVRVQPINTMQPIHSTQADRPQQPILPSSGDPLILVRTADSKYGLAPANQPSRVLVSGEGVRGQDDVKVSGPDSHALAFQQFLLKRQGGDLTHYTPGFYPAPHPSVVHSLTDESISVEALRDSANSSEPETSTAAITSTSPTPPSSSNKDEEEVIDVDGEKPVSIAQVRRRQEASFEGRVGSRNRSESGENRSSLGNSNGEKSPAKVEGGSPGAASVVVWIDQSNMYDGEKGEAIPESVNQEEDILEASVLGVMDDGSVLLDERARQELRKHFGRDVAVVLVSDDVDGVTRRRPLSGLSRVMRIVIRLAYNQLIRPQIQSALPFGGAALGLGGLGGGLGGGLLG